MPKTDKANAATVEARINRVYEYLIAGMTRYQIQQAATGEKSKDKDLFGGIEERQLDNYIASANALLAQEAEYHRGREMGKALARMDTIFAAAMRVQDYSRAIAAAKERHALLGLYAPVQSEIKLTGDGQTALTQLLAKFEELGVKDADGLTAILTSLDQDAGTDD